MIKKLFLIPFFLLLLFAAPSFVFAQCYWAVGANTCGTGNPDHCCGYWDGSNWICVEECNEGCGNCGKWRIQVTYDFGIGDWVDGGWYCYGQGACSPGSTSCSANSYSTCTGACTWKDNGLTSGKCGVAANYGSGCGNCGTVSWDGSCTNQGECASGQTQSQSCGSGGTQIRTCSVSCSWGAWGACTGEGVCNPGQTKSQSCGFGGTQTSTCQPDHQWGQWGACTGGGVCGLGQTESQVCGNCGAQTRTCQPDHQWGQWGACNNQGECASGQTQSQSCGFGGNQTRTCTSLCAWGNYGSCIGSGECNAGAIEKKRCGYCGTTERVCQANYLWGAPSACIESNSCAYSGECDAGAEKTDSCGNICLREVPSKCTGVQIQIRTAPNNNGQPGQWTGWTGPDGTANTYFDASDQQISGMHRGNKFVQFRVLLSSGDVSNFVSLDEFKIFYAGKFNSRPVVISKDYEGGVGVPMAFEAAANDIGGSIVNYYWDFGDNTTGIGNNISHAYSNPGGYDAKITVTDNDGANTSANVKVFINTYNCLSDSTPKSGPGSSLFTPSDPVIQQKAIEALLEYAQKKGIKLQDADTTMEYYEAANDYITRHMTYMPDNAFAINTGWDGVSAKRLFEESGPRGCGNDYCGDCEDFAITTEALLRAMGVSPKCAYVGCSRNHCYMVLNMNSKFRIVEPQQNSLRSASHSSSYEWLGDSGMPNYATTNIFNDEVGVYYITNNADPAVYTINYPSTSGLPDPNRKCPASYSAWTGQGDNTYFEDKCP